MARMTNSNQDQDFCEQLPYLGLNIDLGRVFEYIAENYEPEDIFEDNVLQAWARSQAVEDVTNEDGLMDWGYRNQAYFIDMGED